MEIELIPTEMVEPIGRERAEGIHVSSIIRGIAQLNGILKPEYGAFHGLVPETANSGFWAQLDPEAKLMMSMGLAWEQYYIPTQLRDVVDHQPGELCLEGIYMNMDGEGLDTVLTERGPKMVLAVHEVKLTYKSWNTIKDLRTQWMWLAQIMAYCKGLGTLRAYLHVLCVCGGYFHPIRPMLRVFKLTFTQAEVDENWDILTTFKRHCEQQAAEDAMKDTL